MRKLVLDDTFISKCLDIVKQQLSTHGIEFTAGNNIKFELSTDLLNDVVPKPILLITPIASIKMWALVTQQATKEIAWHGLVKRTDEGFLIEDIVVFPQTTTAATASGGDEEYNQWLLQLDDTTFDKLRFHGHSHVKMGTSPSVTDLTYQDALVKDVKDFYIFGIFNQRSEYWLRIFDIEKGFVYDTKDIIFTDSMLTITEWAKREIKDKEIVKKVATPAPTYSGYATSYGGYSPRQGYSTYDQIKKETNPELYGKKEKGYDYYNSGYGYR